MNRKSSSASSLALIRAQRETQVLTEALKRMKVVYERELKRFASIEEKSHLILEERIANLTEALRIACADAWPDEPHWPNLYMQRARNNMQVQRTENDAKPL